jgi:hypothetical protein
LIGSIRGIVRLYWLLMKAKHPEVTEDDAYQAVVNMGQAKAQEILDQAGGVAPKKKDG